MTETLHKDAVTQKELDGLRSPLGRYSARNSRCKRLIWISGYFPEGDDYHEVKGFVSCTSAQPCLTCKRTNCRACHSLDKYLTVVIPKDPEGH